MMTLWLVGNTTKVAPTLAAKRSEADGARPTAAVVVVVFFFFFAAAAAAVLMTKKFLPRLATRPRSLSSLSSSSCSLSMDLR